jgi:hypothetical protein
MELVGPDVDEWMFDLIARDDLVRGHALTRHQALVASDPITSSHWPNGDRTIFAYLDAFFYAPIQARALRPAYWPFVMLYLWRETRYPDEWRSRDSHPWSPWTRKEVVLRQLGRHGMPEEVKPDAAALLLAAVQRPYRCKDWMYALMVRHVTDAEFHDRVTALADTHDALVHLRARFILDLLGHPERTITRTTWRRWLEHPHGTQPRPRP